VANYNAEAMGPSGAAPETVREDEPVGISNGTPPEGYTIQQVAAFKAHVTMLRKSLSVLTGSARARALEKLARQEARLATALSTYRADVN
jgi:hypothetical protein